jgi:hypothetical protein
MKADQSIIIIGMHRSGTSCLTGCLQQLGLQLGDVSTKDPYNEKGNRENRNISLLNESVLKHSGGSWLNIPNQIIWSENQIQEQNRLLKEYLELREPRGIKDPRMLFLLPFWKNKLKDIQFIGSIRHPLAVAKSLYARKSFSIPISEGIALWYKYNNQLLKYQNRYKFNLIDFDLPEQQYKQRLITHAEKLGLSSDMERLSFYDKNLRKQNSTQEIMGQQIPEKVNSLYLKLKNLSEQSF